MPKPPIAPERTGPIAAHLYRDHYDLLLNQARRSGAGSEAEDVVSLALATFIARFDPDSESPALLWLLVTIKREAWRTARRRADHAAELSRPVSEDGEALGFESFTHDVRAPDPADRVVELETAATRLAAVKQLKKSERTCLRLKAFGYSYKEIQAIMGWSHTKVNRLMAEGRSRLRELSD